jgi:hypothetical protein
LPLAEALSREMASFRAAVKLSASEEEISWRAREHDDLVLAVALAVWEGERNPPCCSQPLILYDRGWNASGHGW